MSLRARPVMALLGAVLASGACGSLSGGSTDGTVTVPPGPDQLVCEDGLIAHHLGLAGGAVHELVWQPYAAGAFGETAPGRQEAITVAARAAALAARQLEAAAVRLPACPALAELRQPVTDAAARSASAGRQLAAGTVEAGALEAARTALSGIEARSATLGVVIVERAPTPAELVAPPPSTG